jgi:hypothetical protein
MNKICKTCKENKQISEFYVKYKNTGCLATECKLCQVERAIKWRHANTERNAKLQREYYNRNWSKVKIRRSLWTLKNQDKVKIDVLKQQKIYRLIHRDKVTARQKLHKKIRDGEIIKKDKCELCGIANVKIQGHHYKGYSKKNWYNVQWLCKSCHVKADKLQRK